jgi:hypothetical protein
MDSNIYHDSLYNLEQCVKHEIENGTLTEQEADEVMTAFISNNFGGAIQQQLELSD